MSEERITIDVDLTDNERRALRGARLRDSGKALEHALYKLRDGYLAAVAQEDQIDEAAGPSASGK